MNKTRDTIKIGILTSVFGLSLIWVGCGGGGDDGGGGGSPAGPSGTPPDSIGGRQFVVQDLSSATAQQWLFSTEGTWDEFTSGVRTRTGTYQYSESSPTATLLLLDQSASNETIRVELRFTNNTSGTYTFTTTPTHRSGAGFFSGLSNTPPPGNQGQPGTPTTGSPNNFAPASLVNRTMLGTRTQTSTGPAGQTHTYTFGVSDFRDQDPPEEGRGVYAYTPNGDTASLLLNYTASSPGGRTLVGDQHNLTLTFMATNSGTFTSTYRSSNDVIQIDGTFTLP